MGNLTFEEMCRMLRDKEPFNFSRWGDGEWQCILGYDGCNCDGTEYAKDLGLSLAAVVLADQTGYWGLQPKSVKDMGHLIYPWMARNGVNPQWCNADILHDASIAGRLQEFADALRGRKVVLIGNERLQPIADALHAPRVNVPLKHVWGHYRQIYGDILDQIHKDCVLLYSMSLPTNIMISQLNSEYGQSITQVSCGSLWEPYAGYSIRRYHNKIIERQRNQ